MIALGNKAMFQTWERIWYWSSWIGKSCSHKTYHEDYAENIIDFSHWMIKYLPSIWKRPCLAVILEDLSFLLSTSDTNSWSSEKFSGFSSKISKALAAFLCPLFWKILIAAFIIASFSFFSIISEMRRFLVEMWLSAKGTFPPFLFLVSEASPSFSLEERSNVYE